MAKIRQEISCYDEANNTDSQGWLVLDTTQFDGTVSYVFEISEQDTVSTSTVSLRRKGTSTDDATIVLAGVAEQVQNVSFTPPAGTTNYVIHNPTHGGEDLQIRIIVHQSGFTKTQTYYSLASQIDSSSSINSTTFTQIGSAEFWKYTAANYDGTKTFQWKIQWKVSSGTGTAELQTSTDGSSWSAVGSDITTTSTSVVEAVTTFTPVDGNYYRIMGKGSTALINVTIVVSAFIITQTASPTKFECGYQIHDSTNGIGRVGATNWDPADWSGVTNTYFHAIASNILYTGGSTGDVISLRSPAVSGSSLTGSSITDDGTDEHLSSAVTMPGSVATIDYNYSSSVNGTITDSRIVVVVVATAGADVLLGQGVM